VHRLFLDANVLFSAAYRDNAGVAQLWSLDNVVLATSTYAVEEAERNLSMRSQSKRLQQLLRAPHVIQAGTVPESTRADLSLPEKDWPIIGGAIAAGATHLITGDMKHFGPYFGKQILGILVLRPRQYLENVTRTS
jgi:uncharacterized protein